MKKINFFSITVATTMFSLIACNNTADNEKKHSDSADSSTVAADTSNFTIVDENEVSYNLPSALQLAYVFKKSSSTFIQTLPNDKINVTKYNTTNYKRATNFGIYSSDLAYCLFNKKYQESKDYLKTCKDLGSTMGLNQAFESENLAKRFDNNLAKEDSLVKIVSSVQLKTDILFEQNKQKYITVIAFAGAWTESAYIAFGVYAKEKNKKVLSGCIEQLLLTETIIKALKHYQDAEPELVNLISTFEKIDTAFKNVPSIKAAIDKGEDIDPSNLVISEDEIKEVIELINTLRKDIVS